MRGWLVALGFVAMLLAGAAGEHVLTGRVSRAPAAVVVSPSPFPSPSPYASASPYASMRPVFLPGPVQTVIVTESASPDAERCLIPYGYGSLAADACRYGASAESFAPREPDCHSEYAFTSSDLERACLWGEGESLSP